MKERLPKGEVLSFGCPDPIFEVPSVIPSPHAAQIKALHGFNGVPPDAEALFKSEGWSITALDAYPSRSIERKADLNEPLPDDLVGRFDVVLDLGTGEHVFNIGQVFKNALAAVKVGGAVMHEHPLIMGNHGFWSTQPTAMFDFYGQNGCDVEVWVCSDGQFTPAHTRRFGLVPDKSTVVCLAFKRKQVDVRWPLQSRYRG